MAALERREYAETADRKLDDLAADLSPVADGAQTEGDYTDALDSALRDCKFSGVSEAEDDDQIQAMAAGVEYYALTRLLYKFLAKPTTQQGAGASGLHLMVQTESMVRSLRLVIRGARDAYIDALTLIGESLTEQAGMKAGAVQLSRDDDRAYPIIAGPHALPWMGEGYYDD